MIPYVEDLDLALYQGDCLDVLRELPDRSVHMCATSPPFYRLRDYGMRGQIGLEDTPEAWAKQLVGVFREMHRVLRDDGTFWLEVGDTYQDKNLVGAPWLLAFALKQDNWTLRCEIIWHKLDGMPESAEDRPTMNHSKVFLFSKQPDYFFDMDPIRERYASYRGSGAEPSRVPQEETLDGSNGEAPRGPDGRRKTKISVATDNAHDAYKSRHGAERFPNPDGPNPRAVWSIATGGTHFKHFAPWPPKLVARMILAGTSEHGCCAECGAPWDRVKDEPELAGEQKIHGSRPAADERDASATSLARSNGRTWRTRRMLGWEPACACGTAERVPAVVLDPFAGSGTTLLVARSLGRHSIGIELNKSYLDEITVPRLAQLSLLT